MYGTRFLYPNTIMLHCLNVLALNNQWFSLKPSPTEISSLQLSFGIRVFPWVYHMKSVSSPMAIGKQRLTTGIRDFEKAQWKIVKIQKKRGI